MPDDDPSNLATLSADELAAHPLPTLFQKVLLTTDGTVTELLALRTGSPIKARALCQTLEVGRPLPFLAAEPGTRLLHRTILLTSASGQAHLHAKSCFVFDRFDAAIQHGLLHTDQPIGLLWKQSRLEMYREIVERRIGPCADAAAAFGLPADAVMLSRTYTLWHGGQVLGVITETFPADSLR